MTGSVEVLDQNPGGLSVWPHRMWNFGAGYLESAVKENGTDASPGLDWKSPNLPINHKSIVEPDVIRC